MGQALYRKYRSKSLGEIVGQGHITDILSRAIAQDKIAHAYLLTGPRGVGKTSIARILAHEINQLPYTDDSQHLDIIEIDAASNNGVEDVRDLREKARIAPVSARRKIYIIDEVHMLSKPAFNALLKTLEEPPEHIVFILATTDADKLPATIISRVQRYTFRPITIADAVAHLRTIAEQESISIDDAALELIAYHGDGSFRDSISLLDQLSSLSVDDSVITRPLVEQMLGLAELDTITGLLEAYQQGNIAEIVRLIDLAEQHGASAAMISDQLIRHIRHTITEHPVFLPLVDALLEVCRSPRPHIKLLVVLAGRASESTIYPQAKLSENKQPTSQAPHAKNPEPVVASTAPSPPQQPTKPAKKPTPSPSPSLFEWGALLDYTRKHSISLHSILSACTGVLTGSTLTIYAGKKFQKNLLDSAKHRPSLVSALASLGYDDLTIETIPSPKPPADSQVASIVAMMGGGEEVDVKES